jgi:hypothetical protein
MGTLHEDLHAFLYVEVSLKLSTAVTPHGDIITKPDRA